MKHVYGVVLAGGAGTRFWPKSRLVSPKQLCRLGDSKQTMLELTLARFRGLIPPRQRIVVTQSLQAQGVRQIVRGKNQPLAGEIIVEPQGRSTLAALTVVALQLAERDPQAIIVSVHADAMVKDVRKLQRCIVRGVQAAAKGYLVLVGAIPAYEEMAYDYIAQGEAIAGLEGMCQARFVHRPSAGAVRRYMLDGGYLWNIGVFIWRVSTFLNEVRAKQPRTYKLLARCMRAGKMHEQELSESYGQLPEISVDAGILADSKKCTVIEGDFGWHDVGSWHTLDKVFIPDAEGNLAFGDTLVRDCAGTTIDASEGMLVAALGLQDMVVVATSDAVLVCPKDRAQVVKKLVVELAKNKKRARFV